MISCTYNATAYAARSLIAPSPMPEAHSRPPDELERRALPFGTDDASLPRRRVTMKPYGLDLRKRIVDAYDNKEGSVRELAERFAVVPNTVQNYLNLRRETDSLDPRPSGGGPGPLIDEQGLQEVRHLVEEHPDATEPELARAFEAQRHIYVSRATMGRARRRLGWTRKKNSSRHGADIGEGPRRAQDLRSAR
jgi:transposase